MKFNIFSTPIFMTNIDLEKIDLQAETAENKWYSNTNTSHGQKNKLSKESYHYLMTVIAKTIMPLLPASSKIKLCNIWKNKYITEDFQENHIHTDSHFSFIIYIKGASRTVFFAPHKHLIECFYGENFFEQTYQSEFRPGQIVIFPSYLEHMVKKSSDIETYAGNLLITDIDEKKTLIEKVNDDNGYICQ